MAAFTETRGQTLSSIRDLLALKNQRKQSQADRLDRTLLTTAGMVEDSRQQGLQREFEGTQGDLDRASRAELTEAQLENNRILQEMQGQQALGQIGARGAEDRLTLADTYRLRQDELNDQQLHELDVINQNLTNQKDLIDYDRAQYANGYYRNQDGAVFTWKDLPTYQAAMRDLEEHQRRLTVLAGQGSDPNNPNSPYNVYIRATDRAKELMWEPEYNDSGQVEWVRSAVTTDQMLASFSKELNVTDMTPEEKVAAIEAFTEYLNIIEQSPPQEFSEPGPAGGTPDTTETESQTPLVDTAPGGPLVKTVGGLVERGQAAGESVDTSDPYRGILEARTLPEFMSELASLSLSPLANLMKPVWDWARKEQGLIDGPEAAAAPAENPVTSREQALFDQLLSLYADADEAAKPEIQAQMEELAKPGESGQIVDIMGFLDRAMRPNQPTTRFTVDRPVQ